MQQSAMAASASSTLHSPHEYHLGDLVQLDLPLVKREILEKVKACSERGLTQTFKWLSELSYALK